MTKLQVGDKAPNFQLKDQDGNMVEIGDFIEKCSMVLFFYPKVALFVLDCFMVTEDAFRISMSYFDELNAKVFGISSDTVECHKSLAKEHQLSFTLLSDQGGKVRKLYGVPNTMFILPGRCTYIIDSNGIIRHIYSSQVKFANHVMEAKKSLELIQISSKQIVEE
ncbi:peroxiredoxin Q/BCP [Galdieria sulphuraria]|uniref:thioredoxin-dependent peroxiredoxin n=1 Tax=Galdieria sulphuraria TaxID=130081 RepID=M2Y3D7_GALSU|nr:peroxiredoxin Q/BCP [Galdieria sulphuraria]EME30488.1 peroxiredoxin Q/BCP [Galdieria sulphuraria]|eukprot:XP_005707008.1 peroxiredoxin Q/BCP [Galdieria sulphuraria]